MIKAKNKKTVETREWEKKCHTPISSLEDKIVEEFGCSGTDNGCFGHCKHNDRFIEQLSLYRQQLLQEYDNMKGSRFRMGYEAGRREVMEEVKSDVEMILDGAGHNHPFIECCGSDILKTLKNKI